MIATPKIFNNKQNSNLTTGCEAMINENKILRNLPHILGFDRQEENSQYFGTTILMDKT